MINICSWEPLVIYAGYIIVETRQFTIFVHFRWMGKCLQWITENVVCTITETRSCFILLYNIYCKPSWYKVYRATSTRHGTSYWWLQLQESFNICSVSWCGMYVCLLQILQLPILNSFKLWNGGLNSDHPQFHQH